MKNRQYIFCVESNSKSKTDWKYIKTIINCYYQKNDDKYSQVYLNGKGNYDSKSIAKKIKELVNKYKGISKIIYCIDLDEFENNKADNIFYTKIEKYCLENNYELVYFVRNIEEVIWNKKVENNEKNGLANKFLKNAHIDSRTMSRFKLETKKLKTSNLFCVMDKYMYKKKID